MKSDLEQLALVSPRHLGSGVWAERSEVPCPGSLQVARGVGRWQLFLELGFSRHPSDGVHSQPQTSVVPTMGAPQTRELDTPGGESSPTQPLPVTSTLPLLHLGLKPPGL